MTYSLYDRGGPRPWVIIRSDGVVLFTFLRRDERAAKESLRRLNDDPKWPGWGAKR